MRLFQRKHLPNASIIMAKHWYYLFFLLWLSYLLVVSILLFTSGFLLSRVTQTRNSTCSLFSWSSCSSEGISIINSTEEDNSVCSEKGNILIDEDFTKNLLCLPKRAKVVLIVIDAFRHDFALYNEKLQQPLAYQNKLPIINELLRASPDSSRLYKFIADPPTTTMQRLKALTTGSLPTFIDAGSNFATAEINEDNIIDQLIKFNQKIIFMGDDTWSSLYPFRFARSYPFPSFNVFDLDTVDSGVIANLYPELEKNDWSFLIAHFLGVDHCGHRYGPTHPEMTRKLTEMDVVIRNVVARLDEDAVLFVIGDHGMTATGDHGGESEDEVTAAMFVHSKIPLLTKLADVSADVVKQVDLVPTLATILGVPIPFSNLGSVIFDALPVANKSLSPFAEWQSALLAAWSNVYQITEYINEYAKTYDVFPSEKLQLLQARYEELNASVRTIRDDSAFAKFAKEAKDYTSLLRKMCEDVWVQFDSFSMSRGLLLTFLTIFFTYMIVDGIPGNRLPEIFVSSFLPCSLIAVLLAIVLSVALFAFNLVNNLAQTIYFSTGLASFVMLGILVLQNWEIMTLNWYSRRKLRNWIDGVCRVVVILNLFALFSNSYVVEEAYVSLFLLFSVVCMLALDGNEFKIKPKRVFLRYKLYVIVSILGILLRISTSFWRCREEQAWCFATFSAKLGATSGKLAYIFTLVCLAVFVTATRNWLRSCGNLVGVSPTIMLTKYAPTIMVVCMGGFWALRRLPQNAKSKSISSWQIDGFAWVVYVLFSVCVFSVIVRPLCIYVVPRMRDIPVNVEENVVPQLFNRLKGLFDNGKVVGSEDANVPIVCGLATVYSAAFVVTSMVFCLLFALLLGESLAPASILMYLIGVLVLVLTAISRYEKASTIAQMFEVPTLSLLVWALLSLYFFYGTGHQPTFPSIAWQAAFIGTGGFFTHNFIPATLIIMNTFGSTILMGITLPLLLIAPFTLHVMFPGLFSKKDFQKDFSRGEILLYENDSVMLNSVFTMSCKYVLVHAVRVFVCMLVATIHCRHLMVWKIFAPKLIFECIGIFVTIGSVVLGYLLLVRVNSRVDRLVTGLNKQTR